MILRGSGARLRGVRCWDQEESTTAKVASAWLCIMAGYQR